MFGKCWCGGADGQHRFGWDFQKKSISIAPPPPEDLNLQETYMNGQETTDGGKKFDENKPRWELIPYDAVAGVAEVLTSGARKYSARNWELGIAYGRVFGALQRHLTAWWQGENNDRESGRSHLDHAMTELMFLSAYDKRGMKEFDDRPMSRTEVNNATAVRVAQLEKEVEQDRKQAAAKASQAFEDAGIFGKGTTQSVYGDAAAPTMELRDLSVGHTVLKFDNIRPIKG